jgi:stress-induced morphogen
LVANGENVKVVQELMRHASSRFTLDVYSQARKAANRHAQQRLVQMILPEKFDDAVLAISLEGTQNDAARSSSLIMGQEVGARICYGNHLKKQALRPLLIMVCLEQRRTD